MPPPVHVGVAFQPGVIVPEPSTRVMSVPSLSRVFRVCGGSGTETGTCRVAVPPGPMAVSVYVLVTLTNTPDLLVPVTVPTP